MLIPQRCQCGHDVCLLCGVVGARAQVPENVVCTLGHAADVDLGAEDGGGVEGYVYESGGRGEGCAVQGCDAGCEGLLLGGAKGAGVVDFVERHCEDEILVLCCSLVMILTAFVGVSLEVCCCFRNVSSQ